MNKYIILPIFTLFMLFSMQLTLISQSFTLPAFHRQSQIDSFKVNYADCKFVSGNLRIDGQDIHNLDSLHLIEEVKGNILVYNTSIDSIVGWKSLRSTNGFSFRNNLNLKYINTFSYLTKMKDSLVVSDCPKLASMAAWAELSEVGGLLISGHTRSMVYLTGLGNLRKAGFFLIENTNIEYIEGFDSLITNWIGFGDNISLKSIKGFKEVQSPYPCELGEILPLQSGIDLIIDNNDSLTLISAFQNTMCISSIYVVFNDQLDTLHICENTRYLGDLTMYINPKLYSYHAFNQVERMNINQIYIFDDHPSIADLQIFKRLKYATSVKISWMAIQSLNGSYGMLDSIYVDLNKGRGDLAIYGNKNLTDISSLKNLRFVNGIYIYDNKNLSNCSIESICNHINAGRKTTIGITNYPGCRSVKQILSKCVTSADNEDIANFKVYPNPTDNFITIESGIELYSIDIYDISGLHYNIKMENNFPYYKLDISGLQPGSYFFHCSSKAETLRYRFVKI